MDRGFAQSDLHQLIEEVSTCMPSLKSYGEIRSGMKLDMSKDELIQCAKNMVKKMLRKSQRKNFEKNVDDTEINNMLEELESKWGEPGGDTEEVLDLTNLRMDGYFCEVDGVIKDVESGEETETETKDDATEEQFGFMFMFFNVFVCNIMYLYIFVCEFRFLCALFM